MHSTLTCANGHPVEAANAVCSACGTLANSLPAPTPPPLPTVPGYQIESVLGRGGMGIVYKARQLGLGRAVALKMIRSGSFADPEELARFRAEAEAVARLQHPNVVQIYEIGEHQGLPFFSLELVSGGSLGQRLGGTPQPAHAAAQLIEALARAVHVAHECGVVHRDLKPANILLSADGTPKVTDFGLAKRLDASTGHTETGAILGTPSYMAPEQAAGKKAIGPAADVYALGATLYECLTGRRPFVGETSLDTIQQVLTQEPIPPSRLQPKVPRDLETICLKCLAKAPERRYATAAALADDLGRFLRAEPIQARPAGAFYHFGKFARRNKTLVSAVVIVLLALIGGSWLWALSVLQRERAEQAEKEKMRLEADSHVQVARLAAQRGRWREALQEYDRALQAGHPDAIGLRLNKVRALLAVNAAALAAQELKRLAAVQDPGEHEGPILLMQGEMLLGGDDVRAEHFIKQALTKRLPEGERAYALALLAETTPTALALLAQAIALDPYHQRARLDLELLLLLHARLDEASSELDTHDVLFPDDIDAQRLRAVLTALNPKSSHAFLDVIVNQRNHLDQRIPSRSAPNRLWSRLSERDRDTMRSLVKFLAEFRNPTNRIDPLVGLPDLSRPWQELQREHHGPRLSGDGHGWAIIFAPLQALPSFGRLPPRLRKNLKQVQHTLERVAKGYLDIAGAARAAEVHPEGTVLYFHAMALFGARRWEDADKTALRAAAAPALLPVQQPALSYAAAAEGMRYFLSRRAPDRAIQVRAVEALLSVQRPGLFVAAAAHGAYRRLKDHADQALLHQALANMRAVLPLIARRPMIREVAVQLTTLAREYNMARQLLDDWEKEAHPTARANLLIYRARAEFYARSYGPALLAAEECLKGHPNNLEMRQIRRSAIQRLKEQVRRFAKTAP